MNDLKLYVLAIFDVAWITAFILSELDKEFRTIGVIVGILVGVFTLWKIMLDIMLKQQDRKMKKLELKLKQKDLEDRIRRDYEGY